MNDIERECVILNSAWDMIDGMVNWAMFVKHDRTGPTNMMFETSQHRRLFIILLGDFLSEIRGFKREPVPLGLKPAPSNARPSDLTFLFHLRHVCENPKLGKGDCCHIRKLLKASGHLITEQDADLAAGNFFEWFHEDIFIYHSSHIAEFLNNIRWSIFHYLRPEFERSWHPVKGQTPDFPLYAYDIPNDCKEPVARAMYWDLMNRVRSKPFMHRFIISDLFKQRY